MANNPGEQPTEEFEKITIKEDFDSQNSPTEEFPAIDAPNSDWKDTIEFEAVNTDEQ